ncbi:MAG: hypothetical protein O3C43_17615 [Verrucomicrobia bacterium]|nr:hypothetical protein [Verrucomicrobiota bacterium]
MAAQKRNLSLLLFIWPGTLVLAFFFGRLTLSNDPAASYQAALEIQKEKSNAKSQPVGKIDTKSLDEVEMIREGVIDPILQIRNALTQNDPLKQMALLTEAFSKLTKDNIQEGIALLDSLPDGRFKQQMETLLYSTWGKLDGPAAMEYVLSQAEEDTGGGRGRGGPVSRGGPGGPGGFGGDREFGGDRGGISSFRNSAAVMSGWAEVDPKNAVAYAAENGSTEGGRNTLMLSAMQGWANNDIEGAINYAINEVPQTADQDRGGRGGQGGGGGGGMENFLINRYVNEDPQAASQWALSQTDPEVRKDAIGTIARSMAADSPEAAALWAQAISDPEAQAEALRGTASGWAREDPAAALNWALNIEDSSVSSQATRSALSTWAREDPVSAGDYVYNMDPGATKDSAAATLTQNLVRQDPEMALLWAESITDPELQTRTLAPITDGWMKRNPEEATNWIQSSTLPEATKQALLAPKAPRP